MRFGFNRAAFFIAWRYLFSKKEHNIINIISGISAVGIMISTAALVVVLSVFNGMSDIIGGWFNTLHADFEITPKEGKSFCVDSFPTSELAAMADVLYVDHIVSDLSLASYDEHQELIYLKGVPKDYLERHSLDGMVIDGECSLEKNGLPCAVIGTGAAGKLQINLMSYEAIKLYYPVRTKKNFANAAESFNTRYLVPSGVVCTNTNYDETHLFCPIEFVRDLMKYENEATSVEITLKNHENSSKCRREIEKSVGEKFVVKDKYEQEESLYKTMKSEKLIIFLILALILVLASFNIIGALGMLIIEKQQDVGVLYGQGANKTFIRKVFVYEGTLVSAIGGLFGVVLGAIICLLQQTFHIVKLGGANGNYIIPYYPVQIRFTDMVLVFLTIMIISALTSLIPAYQIKKSEMLRNVSL